MGMVLLEACCAGSNLQRRETGMALSNLTDETVKKITDALASEVSKTDTDDLTKIVEQALIKAIGEITDQYKTVAVSALGADADKAHKIAEELRKAQIAIVANLEGMR